MAPAVAGGGLTVVVGGGVVGVGVGVIVAGVVLDGASVDGVTLGGLCDGVTVTGPVRCGAGVAATVTRLVADGWTVWWMGDGISSGVPSRNTGLVTSDGAS